MAIPNRDVSAQPTEPTDEPEENIEEPTETAEATQERKRKTWNENFNVKEMSEIETVDRLRVITGVNEYKGNFLVFLAKVTDKEFSRQFFSMPAYVWQKALPLIDKYTKSIAEVEKKSMANAVLVELKRLKELGIDTDALLKQV